MSEFWGADVQKLRDLARVLRTGGDELTDITSAVERVVTEVAWTGFDRESFLSEWTTSHRQAMTATATALHGLSDVIAANADAQQSTSDELVGGGASGGGPGGGGGNPSGGGGEPQRGGEGGNPDDNGKHTTIPPVDLDEESFKPDNISQGQMGDCGLLANLAAVAKADPEFLQEHISYDEKSNTYTVTLYEDGEPVEVKVEGSLIDAAAHEGDGTTAGWVSIYEKAAAQHRGGYEHIQGQPPEDLYEMITGESAGRYETDAFFPWNERSVDEIRDDLDAGKPVTAWTPGDLDDPDIVGGHAYMVESVDEDGNVRVMNPWGPNAGEPHYVTLTAEEFKSKFSEVAVSDKPEH